MVPNQSDPQFKFRLPPEMKERLEASADKHFRSLSSEILLRLSKSLELEEHLPKFFEEVRNGLSGKGVDPLVLRNVADSEELIRLEVSLITDALKKRIDELSNLLIKNGVNNF